MWTTVNYLHLLLEHDLSRYQYYLFVDDAIIYEPRQIVPYRFWWSVAFCYLMIHIYENIVKDYKTKRANGRAIEKLIQIFFPDLNERVLIKLDDSRSPKTVKGLLDSLPIEVKINKWLGRLQYCS